MLSNTEKWRRFTSEWRQVFLGSKSDKKFSVSKISYVLANDNHTDPVIVGCWARSNNTTTSFENLQYTRNTSKGETAVFMYQVPHATFVPASITSLGRTTLARTVSYLVLESPAKDVTNFECAFSSNSRNSPCVTGSMSVISVDLNSVTVELITTNMTFEIGDNYRALMVQVNGSSTQRDQRLLEVTCCRKNVDPKYFVLATTLSLWIDVYPSVQFDWENITVESRATIFSQFDSLCPCDLKVSLCDVGCCCDKACSSVERLTFSCIPGYFGGSTQSAIFEYGCQETWDNGDNYLAILCVLTDNNPFLGLLYDTPPAFAGDNVQFVSLQAGAPEYEYGENETRSLVESEATGSGYRDGVIIKTDRAILTLPQGIGTGACARYAPVSFLRDTVTWCSSEFSESMCSENSPWSALDYLVPITTRSCLTSPQVLSLNSRTNSSVPTHVEYTCIKDSTAYTTEIGKAWGSTSQSGSLFHTDLESADDSSDSRCAFDDGNSKPAVPEFSGSALSRKCSNVVLKVDYHVYWKGTKIVQLRAKVTMGDISAPATDLIVAQRFSVKFTYLKDVDLTKLPFIQPVLVERSGNPGYITGKKVIAKIDGGQSASPLVTINQTMAGQLSLWSGSVSGLCTEAQSSAVLFGVNSLTGCLLRLTLKDFTNCSLLRETVLERQRNLVKATHVARRGNVTLNETKDWVLLLSNTTVPSSNTSVNQSSNVMNFNESQGSCDEVPANLHYEILIREAGKYFGTPQMEIVGAQVRYSTNSWKFQCLDGNCNSCNASNTNSTGKNSTQCTESFQSFAVTSSVNFIILSDKDTTRKKRSEDVSSVCYQDACAEEVFYPLMTSYDDESREVAIAYGLILVAFVLVFVGVSTSLLQNLKTFVIG